MLNHLTSITTGVSGQAAIGLSGRTGSPAFGAKSAQIDPKQPKNPNLALSGIRSQLLKTPRYA